MVDDLMGAYGGRLVIAVAGVALALLALVLVLWLVRRRSGPSPFLRGGKNRQPRLQVLDAAAVDARRRIVLVRRDDVEHLVMIGGPTDIVIESGIRTSENGTLSAMPPGLPSRREDARLAPQAEPAALNAPPRRLEAPAEPVVAPTGAAVAMQRLDAAPARPRPRAEPAAPAVAGQTAPTAPVQAAGEAEAPRVRRIEPAEAQPARPDAGREASRDTFREARTATEQTPAPPPADPAQPAVTVSQAPTDLGAASDVLEAARRRVFQSGQSPQPEADRESRRDSQPASPATATAPALAPISATPAPARTLGSDFDRILEEEMASNLAADRRDRPAVTATPSTPRRDPAAPRITGAAPEPSLQAEVARIFGEMSVTRDDR